MSAVPSNKFVRQHVIDPEICIRCNTCEATCPIGAITHDSRNYVVDFNVCNGCGACVPPCPTGAIDNWRDVTPEASFTLAEQFSWDALPAAQPIPAFAHDEIPEEVRALTQVASAGQGTSTQAPHSAALPCLNLYTPTKPAQATVAGNFRLTSETASADVRHIVLDFGSSSFPILEGQTIGILPPGTDASGRRHFVRLYSVASPRDGERSGHNNVALTVKRVTHDHMGAPVDGVGSNYLCDLKVGDPVQVVGPYGATFLMPNHPGSSLMMICTGTGSAPMRAMTEYRRRYANASEAGELFLFFGARAPEELPYFGPLMKLPKEFIDINLAFSRAPDRPKRYVQDLIRARGDAVIRLLQDENCFVYVCGLKAMEHGVLEAFSDVCRERGMDWNAVKARLAAHHRLHIETY
jgi:benzoyl-CoA 2,3-dioxygenase component A